MRALQRVVAWWYQGWQQFAAAAGGRGEDWVGPNPWKRAAPAETGGGDD